MTNENVESFKKNGYCIIRSAIPEELRDFITQYALFDEMQDFNPDGRQVPNAHAKYADPAMETMLMILHKQIEENTGLTVLPTYSFYRVYRDGDKLEHHKDRESCEISTTLCFNYSYNDTNFSWPIFMNGAKADLRPGDMVIYRGCDLDHWREEFRSPSGDSWHVQGFFHYVDANGPYKDFKFDRRSSIGLLRKNSIKEKKSYIQYTNNSL